MTTEPLTVDSSEYTADSTDLTADQTEISDGSEVVWSSATHYVTSTHEFLLIQDDDYVYENGLHIELDLFESTVDLETATASVSAKARLDSDFGQFDGEASIVGSSSKKIRIEWPSAGASAHAGKYVWQAKIIDSNGLKKTIFEGPLTLRVSSDA